MALVSPVEASARISNAIRKASQATGTDFNYLLTTAARESSFKTQARAKTSSAAGLFQFIENTWLQTLKEEGARFGLGEYSAKINRTRGGRYYVPNRTERAEILKLRHDPEISALMAGAFTQQNTDYVSERLGRKPTQGELYIAHFLGPHGATKLITRADDSPSARADRVFPKAARANRGIFYNHGRPRSLAQVYDLLVSDHSRMESVALAAARQAQPVKSVQEPQRIAAAAVSVTDTGHPVETLHTAENRPEHKPAGLVATTRVAALDQKALPTASKTMTDAAPGSIGAWQTIIEPVDKAPGDKPESKQADETPPAPTENPRRRARSPRSLLNGDADSRTESLQKAKRHAVSPAAKARRASAVAAARATSFGAEFLRDLSLTGS